MPEFYNIGVDACDRHADDPERLALIFVDERNEPHHYTFADIRAQSNAFANVLADDGLTMGDRLGVFLPQSPETAIAHIAAFKAGIITVPLFYLFGEEALLFRLGHSGARAVVTDQPGCVKLLPLLDRLPRLARIYIVGACSNSGLDDPHCVFFDSAVARADDSFTPIRSRADDPALMIYTSGTTGPPKGALHAHRVLLGHLPGVELAHDFFPQPGDLFWTPADWAWIGGLLDCLLPAWHHGVPVLSRRAGKFDPQAAMDLMADFGVRNTFLPPTALKLLRKAGVKHSGLHLRTVASGGEPLGEELLSWGREVFCTSIHEFYGQTECNMVVANDADLFPIKRGSMGRAVPGHHVHIVDEDGNPLQPGELGLIGIRRPDPVMFLGYWQDPEATRRKFAGDYLLTGDLARQDTEGYLTFVGRTDDLITSSGYRIGPAEVENCLLQHGAVAMAAVVGVPDPIRTEAVKAWIVLKPGHKASNELAKEIQDFVRNHLAAHEYPRHISFVDSLPMTTTGKILRRELRSLPEQ